MDEQLAVAAPLARRRGAKPLALITDTSASCFAVDTPGEPSPRAPRRKGATATPATVPATGVCTPHPAA